MSRHYFPVALTRDNRIRGLLQEMREALEDCDDPDALRRAGVDLKALGDAARGKGYAINPRKGSRIW